MEKDGKNRYTLNYPLTFLIGFGFLASSLAWGIYNAQVPLILDQQFLLSRTMIGTIMTIDNFFGVILQPLIGTWSDNTRTPYGRRLPWITIGLPVCAIIFSIIPLQSTLFSFMLAIIAFNFIMALWRSPVVALMPDVTPSPMRSEANGIINLMGGVGAIIALFVGGYLSDLTEDKFYAFFMGTVIMLLALVILLIFVREPDSILYRQEKKMTIKNNLANRWGQEAYNQLSLYATDVSEESQKSLLEDPTSQKVRFSALLDLPKDYQRSLIAILIAIFAWFIGYNAIETFFTLYATKTYGVSGGQATMMLSGFSLTFLLTAIPAGKLAHRIGRKKSILIGLAGISVIFMIINLQPNPFLLQVLLIIGGGFWAMININSLPMVLEFATEQSIGAFTGYYYLFSFSAAIISPIFYGFLQDYLRTDSMLFAFALLCFMIAFISMLFVNHGEESK